MASNHASTRRDRTNKAYFEARTKVHAEDSLDYVIQQLVKNWEVESQVTVQTTDDSNSPQSRRHSHKMALDKIEVNSKVQRQASKARVNTLLNDSSNIIITEVFTEGFAFEVMEVFSGPPNVSFKWRHFGRFGGQLVDDQGQVHKGDGRMTEVVGMCTARVSKDLRIQDLEVFYDTKLKKKPSIHRLEVHERSTLCPFSDGMCRDTGSDEEDDEDEVEQDAGIGEVLVAQERVLW